MNRRGFLKFLSTGVAASLIDPAKALWTPGTKVISIPSPQIWHPGMSLWLKYGELYGTDVRQLLIQGFDYKLNHRNVPQIFFSTEVHSEMIGALNLYGMKGRKR